MGKHIKNDDVVSMKEVRKIETELNEHVEYAVRITNAGANTGQTKRIKSNLKTVDNQIPILSGTHKDHKKVENEVEGPDVRPIMGAMVGPNVGISNFVGREVIRNIAEEAEVGNVCKSTEEVLNTFEEYNRSRIENGFDMENIIIGSMDIEKWYPSMIAEPSAKGIKEMILKSEVEFEGINYEEVCKYLGKFLTREQILEEKLEGLLYIEKDKVDVTLVNNDDGKIQAHKKVLDVNRKAKSLDTKKRGGINVHKEMEKEKTLDTKKGGGKDVTIVNEDDEQNKAHKEEFITPARAPDDVEKRKMLAIALEIMIVAGMKNHVYKFGNQIRKQKTGGPIGLGLTGEVADCYMIEWDKKFLEKLNGLGITPIIYVRFKDDTFIAAKKLEKGTKLENGCLVIDNTKKAEDENKSDEEVTMEVIKDVAESIDKMLKFTVDLPSNHQSGKLPVLDVQVSVNKEENNRIYFEFFEKPTKNKLVILSDAAISSQQKRTILTQECLRRMRNTKVELGKETQIEHLNNFMIKMKNSGYSSKYRMEVLNSALKAFDKMLSNDKNNIKPLYRSRRWKKENESETKVNKKHNWYKNFKVEQGGAELGQIDYKSVLFVPITKGGKLAKEMKKREEEINKFSQERIKIVEDGGG